MSTSVELKAVITAKDEATSKIKGAEMSFGKLTSAVGLGNIAANAFQKGLSLVTTAIGDSVTAAMDAQAAMSKVDTIIRTLTGNYDKNKEAILKASNAALQLGFDDESAAESMAKLQQITGDSTLAQDYLSAAMDVARFKGISLEGATDALTIAMQGNGRILKQLGIDVPDNASKAEILGLVMDKVKGQAKAFGDTAAGAQQKLAEQIENVKEKFGTAILKGLQPFIDKLTTWIQTPEAQQFLEDLAGAVESIMTALQDIMPIIEGFIKLISGDLKTTIFDQIGEAISDFIEKIPGGKWIIDKLSGDVSSPEIFRVGKRQSGGYITAGQPYMVGEAGPEMIVPSSSGHVIPNNKLGATVNINFNNATVRSDNDLDAIISAVKRSLTRDLSIEQLGV